MAFTSRDAVESFQEVDVEQLAMAHRTRVVSGGAITLDPSDLTYDLAATVVQIDGVRYSLAAAANAGTLVPGATNDRWAQVLFDKVVPSFVLVHGAEAASPSKPAIDFEARCLLWQLRLKPSDTTAITVQNDSRLYDKRIVPVAPYTLLGSDTTERSTTSATAVSLVTITVPPVPVTTPLLIRGAFRKPGGLAQVQLGLMLNATTVITPANVGNAQTALYGQFEFYVPPRVADYRAFGLARFTDTGGAGSAVLTPAADSPAVDVTSVIIRATVAAGATLFAKDVFVYGLPA